MTNKRLPLTAPAFTVLTTLLAAAPLLHADPYLAPVGSVWGHPAGTAAPSVSPAASIYGDPLARGVGDLVTIVVDLQNAITKDQNTKTSKDTNVDAVINALLYPNDGTSRGYNFYNYHGASPTTQWNSTQSFNGGGTVANTETASTTIQARVVEVESNGVLRVEAVRLSKAGDEDTRMILTGLVRPEDLSTNNTISSSRVADLQIVQKGKGTITNNQRKGWLTKFYEFIEPF
ncbi:MAG: flagellar basal body L-ring protein FlgH [Verrucomicrobiota bacterium]